MNFNFCSGGPTAFGYVSFVGDTIADGTFHVKLSYQLNIARHESINITFIDERINLCDQLAADSGHLCPLKPGNYIMTGTEVVPALFKPVN